MPLIDSHLHLFRAATPEYPRDCGSFYAAEREALVEDFIKVMKKNDVRHAVIVPLGTELRYLGEILVLYPDLFSGIAVLDPSSTNPQSEIQQWESQLGIKGIRVMGMLGATLTTRFSDLYLAGALREMAKLKLILWFYGSEDQLRLVHVVARELPELRIVLNHLGFCQQGFTVDSFNRPHIESDLPPSSLAVVEELSNFPNVFVMFSGPYGFSHQDFPYLDVAPIATRVLDAYGANRLLWGSDWPWIEKNPSYSSLTKLSDVYFPQLNLDQRQMIMGGTAASLFGWNL